MTTRKKLTTITQETDYDPNSMPVDKARNYIKQFLHPVSASECVSIRESLGRVLSKDVISPVNVPQHDNSAMDGYAIRTNDISNETTLTTIGTSLAGSPFTQPLKVETCVRISTGAEIPQGADGVIMQENVSTDNFEYVHIYAQNLTLNLIETLKTSIYNTKNTKNTKLYFRNSFSLQNSSKMIQSDLHFISDILNTF